MVIFCNNIQKFENRDDVCLYWLHREYEKIALDEVQVYRDVQAIEERRRLEGRSPKVRFLSSEEQRAWEGLYSKLPGDVASDVERREGEQR